MKTNERQQMLKVLADRVNEWSVKDVMSYCYDRFFDELNQMPDDLLAEEYKEYLEEDSDEVPF